jgi:hypothetical protein
MKRHLEEALAQCLDDIQAGRASVEDCIERFPELQEELEPLLQTALSLPPLPDTRPSYGFRLRARQALQWEIERHPAPSPAVRANPLLISPLARGRRLILSPLARGRRLILSPLARGRRLILSPLARGRLRGGLPLLRALRPRLAARPAIVLLATLFIVAALFGGGCGVVLASQSSLPGELLYPVKTTTEKARLLVTFSPTSRAEHHAEMAERRLQEVMTLAEAGKSIRSKTVQSIAEEVDAALVEVRALPPENARAVVSELFSDIVQQQATLSDARVATSAQTAGQLAQAELFIQRVQVILEELTQDPRGPASNASVKAISETELKGLIISLTPFQVAGVSVDVPPDARVEGTPELGKEATVIGAFTEGATLQAAFIQLGNSQTDGASAPQPAITAQHPVIAPTIAPTTAAAAQRPAETQVSLENRSDNRGQSAQSAQQPASSPVASQDNRGNTDQSVSIVQRPDPTPTSVPSEGKGGNREQGAPVVQRPTPSPTPSQGNRGNDAQRPGETRGLVRAPQEDEHDDEDDEEDKTLPKITLRGVIARIDPLTIAGRIVVVTDDAEVQGNPRVGLIASVEGRVRKDGSIIASELKVERLAKKIEQQGRIASLNPLTVGKTVVTLAPGAEVKGNLQVGATVKVEGVLLEDGVLLAAEIKVTRGPNK